MNIRLDSLMPSSASPNPKQELNNHDFAPFLQKNVDNSDESGKFNEIKDLKPQKIAPAKNTKAKSEEPAKSETEKEAQEPSLESDHLKEVKEVSEDIQENTTSIESIIDTNIINFSDELALETSNEDVTLIEMNDTLPKEVSEQDPLNFEEAISTNNAKEDSQVQTEESQEDIEVIATAIANPQDIQGSAEATEQEPIAQDLKIAPNAQNIEQEIGNRLKIETPKIGNQETKENIANNISTEVVSEEIDLTDQEIAQGLVSNQKESSTEEGKERSIPQESPKTLKDEQSKILDNSSKLDAKATTITSKEASSDSDFSENDQTPEPFKNPEIQDLPSREIEGEGKFSPISSTNQVSNSQTKISVDQLKTETQEKQVFKQISEHVSSITSKINKVSGEATTTINLEPGNLGQISVQIISKDSETQIKLFAKEPETYRLIQEGWKELMQDLEKVTSSENASLSFSLEKGDNPYQDAKNMLDFWSEMSDSSTSSQNSLAGPQKSVYDVTRAAAGNIDIENGSVDVSL